MLSRLMDTFWFALCHCMRDTSTCINFCWLLVISAVHNLETVSAAGIPFLWDSNRPRSSLLSNRLQDLFNIPSPMQRKDTSASESVMELVVSLINTFITDISICRYSLIPHTNVCIMVSKQNGKHVSWACLIFWATLWFVLSCPLNTTG